jgi:hypothetical protein
MLSITAVCCESLCYPAHNCGTSIGYFLSELSRAKPIDIGLSNQAGGERRQWS